MQSSSPCWLCQCLQAFEILADSCRYFNDSSFLIKIDSFFKFGRHGRLAFIARSHTAERKLCSRWFLHSTFTTLGLKWLGFDSRSRLWVLLSPSPMTKIPNCYFLSRAILFSLLREIQGSAHLPINWCYFTPCIHILDLNPSTIISASILCNGPWSDSCSNLKL